MHRALAVALAALPLSGCGGLFSCYDATLVGTASYKLTVVDKRSGKRRGIHTIADSGTIVRLMSWQYGDELVVCNDVVTNLTKKNSAVCGDFGCLAIWP